MEALEQLQYLDFMSILHTLCELGAHTACCCRPHTWLEIGFFCSLYTRIMHLRQCCLESTASLEMQLVYLICLCCRHPQPTAGLPYTPPNPITILSGCTVLCVHYGPSTLVPYHRPPPWPVPEDTLDLLSADSWLPGLGLHSSGSSGACSQRCIKVIYRACFLVPPLTSLHTEDLWHRAQGCSHGGGVLPGSVCYPSTSWLQFIGWTWLGSVLAHHPSLAASQVMAAAGGSWSGPCAHPSSVAYGRVITCCMQVALQHCYGAGCTRLKPELPLVWLQEKKTSRPTE